MRNFALIDNCSGYVWYTGRATTTEDACRDADLDTGDAVHAYLPVQELASNQSGYLVYAAPDGYTVADGQDRVAIATVAALPLVGRYRARVEGE